MASKLRVRAREGIVTRADLLQHGVRRMVGQRLEAHADAPGGFAWVPTGETEELPDHAHFRTALKEGALWAADEATAKAVWPSDWRKHFDPTFGTVVATEHHEINDAAPTAEEKV